MLVSMETMAPRFTGAPYPQQKKLSIMADQNDLMRIYRTYNKDRMMLVQEEPRGPSQVIEIPVTANGQTRIQIPDQPNLRNQTDQTIVIKALRVIPPTILTNAPFGGQATSPLTELVKASVTLYCEGWEKGQTIPLCTLIDTFTEGSGVPFKDRTTQLANWLNVDWNKSYIQFANTTSSAGQPYAFLLEVEYVKLNKDFKEIIGPST